MIFNPLPSNITLGNILGPTTVGSIISNPAEIALAKALSLTPFVGFIGDIIFAASSFWVHTFENLVRQSSGRHIEHEVINGPPVSEFVGRDLKSLDFEMTLHATLGVEPLTAYQKIEEACESGQPKPVYLSGKNHGLFTIRSCEGDELHWSHGRPSVMKVALSLREYVDSLPTVSAQKLRQDELNRNFTGRGGPERLPGTGTASDAAKNGVPERSFTGWK